VPHGGPNGGDGGTGGDVYFVASSRVTSLEPVRYRFHVKAGRGTHGKGSDCHGKKGEEVVIAVPRGTLVRDIETGELLADLVEDDHRFLAARGGQGGKGNARFATSTDRAPRFAELGEPGQEAEYLLELKLIAEVGIVGLPNAGKSTLLARISAARPKIDDYPFTTLTPNLGVVMLDRFRTLTVADIPGLIEGAAAGKGLGHDFLRHIERTKVLLFLIDLGDPDPAATRAILEGELAEHSPVFAQRSKVVALNKVDITENRAQYEAVASQFDEAFLISGANGEGVAALLEHLWATVDRVRKDEAGEPAPVQPAGEYVYEAPYTIEQTPTGFRVDGRNVMRSVQMTNFDNESAVRHLHDRLRKMGLLGALKRMGAKAGDTIIVGDVELEYQADE